MKTFIQFSKTLKINVLRNTLFCTVATLISINVYAQNNVGIGTNTPNSKAILELQATDKGLLAPRMNTMQMNAILTPPNGLLVYNTTENCFNYYNTNTATWKSMCTTTGIGNSGDTVVINLLKVDSLFAHYIKADSAFIKNLFSTYIKSDSAYIKLLRADSAFIKYLYAHTLKADTIIGGWGKFDSLYVGGKNIMNTISDSISTQAWLLKGNTVTGNKKLGTLNAQDLHIVTNGSDKITILNGTGNVGIGQLLPASKLDVVGDIKFTKELRPAGNAGTTGDLLVSQGLGNAPQWKNPSTLPISNNAWNILGNAGTNDTINFLGTTDNQKLTFKVNDTIAGKVDHINQNTFMGYQAGTSKTTSSSNVAVGFKSLNSIAPTSIYVNIACLTNTTIPKPLTTIINLGGCGNFITSIGNTAIGTRSLFLNDKASYNTATGFEALYNNIGNDYGAGSFNVANGAQSLFSNNLGSFNVAAGLFSLYNNLNGVSNTAFGTNSGMTNVDGNVNTFIGYGADATLPNLINATALGNNAKVGANNSFVLGDNANIGIGTSIPTERLDVVGNVKFSQSLMPNNNAGNVGDLLVSQGVGVAPLWQNGSSLSSTLNNSAWTLLGNISTNASTNFIGTTDNIDFVTRTNNTERMRVTALGNIGIGTVAPYRALHVTKAGSAMPFLVTTSDYDNTATGSMFSVEFGATSGNTYTSLNALASGGTAWDNLILQRLGNVGIGTIAPAWKLDVQGGRSMFSASSETSVLGVRYDPTTYPFFIGATNVLNTVANTAAGLRSDLVFTEAGGTERMRIVGSNGNVGINTTTPSEKLEVNGSIKITDGTQGAGKVLTSDLNGKASWGNVGLTAPSSTAVNWNAGTVSNYNYGAAGTDIAGPYTVPTTGWYILSSRWFVEQNLAANPDNGSALMWIQINTSSINAMDQPGQIYETRIAINSWPATPASGAFVYMLSGANYYVHQGTRFCQAPATGERQFFWQFVQ
jgi:hypothetical protein